MSNLFKSKFLLGVAIVAVMFVGAVAIKATPAAADCSITTTLRVGSTGAQVVCLQTALGGLTADGSFGPKTKAAVVAWQSKSGLVADGIFGPKSNAVWAANQGNVGVFPVGCTSASGYSLVTGYPCYAAPANLFAPTGCTTASGYSPVTGGACYAVSAGPGPTGFTPAGCTSANGYSPVTGGACQSLNLPAGCTSTSGYSPTTGLSCSGAVAPVVSASGEGSMSLYSAPVALTSNVGPSDVSDSIMAFGIKATGSNITVNRINVSLASSTSSLPWKYFTNLYLYNGSTLIGSIPVTSTTLTENTFGTNYTAIFGGLTAVIAKDTTSYFTVKADIVATIPVSPTTYTVGLNDASTSQPIRGTDGSGLTEYLGTGNTNYNRSITFTGASSGTLTVVTDGSNPLTNNVVTSATNTTSGVVGLVFDLQNTSKYDVTLKSLSATLGNTNTNISGYYLYDGGLMIASVGTPVSTTLAFTNLPSNVIVSANSTKVMSIKFDVNATATPGNQSVTVAGSQITAIDSNSNLLTGTTVPTGTATGNVQTLQSTGVVVNLVSANATVTPSTSGVSGYATGTFVFTVKANGVNLAKLSTWTYLQATGTGVSYNATQSAASYSYTVSPDTAVSDGSQVTVTLTSVTPKAGVGLVNFTIGDLKFENSAITALIDVSAGLSNFYTNSVYQN